MASDSSKALLLQINANIELLKSNLAAGLREVDNFTEHTEERLEIIDLAFEKVGEKVHEHAVEIGAAIAGIFAIEALTEFAEKGLELAASLGEVAKQVGVTARDLQVFRYAATQVGVSTEEMDKGLQKFTKSLGQARAGSEETGKIFKAIGFTDDQIKHLDVHEALLKTAEGIAAIGDRATRAVPETQLFGRAGQQLDPLLSQGAKGIEAFAAQAEKLGLIIPDEFLERAARAEHTVAELKQVLSVNIASAVAQNADAIEALAHALEAVAIGAAHAVQRFTGFVAIAKSEGFIAALAAGGQEKDQAGTSQGLLDRERTQYEAARKSYHDNPTSTPQLENYRAAVGRFRDALSKRQAEIEEEKAADKIAEEQGQGNGLGGVLAPKGPKGKSAAELAKEAEEARKREVERQKHVADESAKLDDEYLSARSALTANTDEQAIIARQRLAAETAAKNADLDKEVADGKVKPAEEPALREKIARNATARLDDINQKSNIRDQDDAFALANRRLDLLKDELASQSALATTARERRAIALRELEADKANEKAQLQAVADDAARPKSERHYSDEQIASANAGLADIDKRYAGKADVIKQQTGSPIEDFRKQLDENVGDIRASLQQIEVNAVDKIGDSLEAAALKGLHLHGVLGSIVGDLLKVAEQRLELAVFGGSSGGGGGLLSLLHLADGGHVSGPGSSRSDSVPAMLSAGEFVVNAKATSSHIDILHAINDGRVARFSDGGLVAPTAPRAPVAPSIPSLRQLGEQRAQAAAVHFHLDHPVMTQDLLDQMNRIGSHAADVGATRGAADGHAKTMETLARKNKYGLG